MSLRSSFVFLLMAGCVVYDVPRGAAVEAGAADGARGEGGSSATGGASSTSGTGGGGARNAGASGMGGGGAAGSSGASGAAGSSGRSGAAGAAGGSDGGAGMTGVDASMDADASRGVPRNAFIESGGSISIEAEHFVASVAGTGPAAGIAWANSTVQPDTSGSCEQALPKLGVNTADTLEGPELEYDLRFVGSGTYYLWVRILGGNFQSDSVHLVWDAGPPLTYGGQGIGANSATWIWRGEIAGVLAGDGGFARVKVDVGSPGYHTLRVHMREDGVAIDKIVITKDLATPTGMGPAESRRE